MAPWVLGVLSWVHWFILTNTPPPPQPIIPAKDHNWFISQNFFPQKEYHSTPPTLRYNSDFYNKNKKVAWHTDVSDTECIGL
jgi:hypothetical protein